MCIMLMMDIFPFSAYNIKNIAFIIIYEKNTRKRL